VDRTAIIHEGELKMAGPPGGAYDEALAIWGSASLLCASWKGKSFLAQRLALHYFPGDSSLHRWDARCKFFGLLMITATLLSSKFAWLTFDSILLFGLLILSRLPLRQFFRDFRIWAIFLIALFLFQVFFTPGPRVFTFSWLPISQDGLRLGIFTCWRLSLIFGYSVLFTAITRPREIQNTLIWILKPVPFLRTSDRTYGFPYPPVLLNHFGSS
jgi:hypothetical protein